MNLVNPTIGDIIDRLSILSMRDTDEARTEAAALLDTLATPKYLETLNAKVFVPFIQVVAALGAVNGRLWEMHERPEGILLTEAMELNRRRRELAEKL